MRDDVRNALDVPRGTSLADRTIDITTHGRRSGQLRRIEICFYRVGDTIYLSGVPAPRTRDWLHNLSAQPAFVFHLKNDVVADLPAHARVISDGEERRRVLTAIVEEFNERNGEESQWGKANLDKWLRGSPLAEVAFDD